MAERFTGAPYPIVPSVHGYLRTQSSLEQIKSDILILLLTNPSERIMLPDFGTPLRTLIFEPNTAALASRARQMIIDAITAWEPRVVIQAIDVTTSVDPDSLDLQDDRTEIENIMFIRISFYDPENIQEVQELRLDLPLGTK